MDRAQIMDIFRKNTGIDDAGLLEMVADITKEYHLSKGDIVVKEGKTFDTVYLILKGIVKAYCEVSINGEEVDDSIVMFQSEGEWILNVDFEEDKSQFTTEMLEDGILLAVPFAFYRKMCTEYQLLAEYSIMQLAQTARYYLWLANIKSVGKKSAIDAVRMFQEKYPDKYARCTQQDIANLIGISKESFSRVKKMLVKEN